MLNSTGGKSLEGTRNNIEIAWPARTIPFTRTNSCRKIQMSSRSIRSQVEFTGKNIETIVSCSLVFYFKRKIQWEQRHIKYQRSELFFARKVLS